MLYRVYLSALFFLMLSDCFGQLSNKKFTTYTTDNGLCDNAVVKVAGDNKKFLWIATRNGLSRFDGINFTNYLLNNPAGNGLRSSWITDLLVDHSGKLWVSTEWGICRYDENSDRFYYVTSDVILYKSPMCLLGETLWASTESGIRKINTATSAAQLIAGTEISDPQSICSRPGGKIWIGTRGHGLFEYDTLLRKLRTLFVSALPAGEHVMDLHAEADDLWIATGAGLVLIKPNGESFRYTKRQGGPATDSVSAIMFVTSFPPLTGDSMLFCGCYNKTAALFNKRTRLFTSVRAAGGIYGLPATVFNSAVSFNNALWLSTEKGLVTLNEHQQEFNSFLLRSAGKEWAGCLIKKALPCGDNLQAYLLTNAPAGVVVCDRSNGNVAKFMAPPGPRTYEGLLANSNEILAVHRSGVDRFSPATGITQVYRSTDHTIYCGMAEAQNRWWLGCDDGIISADPHTGKSVLFSANFRGTAVENNSFPGKFLTAAIADDGKKLWLASLKYGLFSFEKSTGIFTPYRQQSLAAYDTRNRCIALQFDKTGKLWIANFAGLTAFDTSAKTFTNYSGAEGLGSTYLYDIAVSDSNIIGRGNSGIFYFDLRTKKFRNINLPALMTGNVYNQRISLFGKEAIIGFEGGYAEITAAAGSDARAPQSWLTSFKVENNRRPIPSATDETILSYTENIIALEWAAPEYVTADEISFQYRLGNAEWINAGKQRSALFTGLRPGSYEFSLRSTLPDGSTGPIASVHFKIRPPFWQTGIFIVLASLAFLALLFWLYKIRINRLAREQRIKMDYLRQQFEIAEITSFFSKSLLDKTTAAEVLHGVTKDLIGRLGFDDCMIYLYDPVTEKLRQTAGYGRKGDIEQEENQAKFNIEARQGIVGRCFTTEEPVMVNDTETDEDYFSADGMQSGSELCVPFTDGNKTIGVINVEQKAVNFFTDEHLKMLNTIAVLVSTKISALEHAAKANRKELELSEASNRITSTELALLRSRMNPHFIFNSLNSIQAYIWDSKQEDAAEYLTKFARLMRMVLEHSNNKTITLAEELAALKLYIELEQRRSNQTFDYTINTDPALDTAQIFVPPLFVQPFVENAIWHGMARMPRRGMLIVSVMQRNNKLIFVIDDNGIGREAAGKAAGRNHASMGLDITRRRIALIGENAELEIEDKKDTESVATGTKIIITLPLKITNA